MNISQTKEYIKQVKNIKGIVPALIGPKGIGKTELIKQVAKECGIGYQAVYPSSLQGEDFMGLLEKDSESKTTRYLAPDFLPTKNAVKKGLFPEEGIFVLEEFNRGDTQTISSLFPLLQERNINGHELADGWSMAVCVNPDNMQYTTNSLDNAGLSRILTIEVSPDLDEYTTYMIKEGRAHDDILNFLHTNKEMFNIDEISDNMDKSPSPRDWSKACDVLSACDFNEMQIMTTMTGLVGSSAAASYMGFLKDKDIVYPEADNILKSYSKKQKEIIETIMEKQRLDIMTLTFKRLVLKLDVSKKSHVTNILKFIDGLDSELKIILAKQIVSERRSESLAIIESIPGFKGQVMDRIIDIERDSMAA